MTVFNDAIILFCLMTVFSKRFRNATLRISSICSTVLELGVGVVGEDVHGRRPSDASNLGKPWKIPREPMESAQNGPEYRL